MRQKTTPRARKKKTASSGNNTGLIAKKSNRAQSAGTKSILDNRSHRERLVGSRTRGSRAKHGGAGSRPFTSYTFHSLPGQPRGARRSVKLVLAAVIGGRWHSHSWLPYTGAWPRAPSTRGSRRDRPS